MHPRVYEEFDRIVSARGVAGSVLEVGALPSEESLLCMDSLRGLERIGYQSGWSARLRRVQDTEGKLQPYGVLLRR